MQRGVHWVKVSKRREGKRKEAHELNDLTLDDVLNLMGRFLERLSYFSCHKEL